MNTGFTLFICQRFLYWNEILQNNNIMTTSTIFMFIYLDTKIPPTLLLSNFFFQMPSPEAVTPKCSAKKLFLKVSWNSKENTCVGFSFLIKFGVKLQATAGLLPATLLKKRLQDRCFSVNFAKFVRTTPVAASSGLNNVRSNLY